ncbi:MAG TPA: heme NO-binding domain-containing protein [Candidatus Angelobacter sp.]|jgi:hypothetical protein|nr:heme NO-binding domain-containing protein [Candidatus Angelobacter sp.]
MHGLIFVELRKYVVAKFDEKTWEQLLEKAGLKHQMFLASTVYPDQDAIALVSTACQMTGAKPNAVLEDFGEFILPDLIEQYKFLVKTEWGLLDFLQNTEETIHKIMRFHKGVTPPRLGAHRIEENKLLISYSSQRKMCALLKGMVRGAAKFYKEDITMIESRCMLQGDSECVVSVQVDSAKVRPAMNAFQKSASPNV